MRYRPDQFSRFYNSKFSTIFKTKPDQTPSQPQANKLQQTTMPAKANPDFYNRLAEFISLLSKKVDGVTAGRSGSDIDHEIYDMCEAISNSPEMECIENSSDLRARRFLMQWASLYQRVCGASTNRLWVFWLSVEPEPKKWLQSLLDLYLECC